MILKLSRKFAAWLRARRIIYRKRKVEEMKATWPYRDMRYKSDVEQIVFGNNIAYGPDE